RPVWVSRGLAPAGITGSARSASSAGFDGVGLSAGLEAFGGGCDGDGISVVEAGGGGGGTLTRACLGWPQELINNTAISTTRSIVMPTKEARDGRGCKLDDTTWAESGAVPCSRRTPPISGKRCAGHEWNASARRERLRRSGI